MNVTLCSAFRNATPYLERYCHQVSELAQALADRDDSLSCVWGEGDHTDHTRRVLEVASVFYDADVVNVSHGGPDHGSIVNAERFANLSKVWNAIWARIPQDADAVVFVESDLIWEPATIIALLDDLAHVPAVAPMVMLEREGFPANQFYDCWAFRKDGKHFRPQPPYFDESPRGPATVLDSAGSCIVMRGDVARGLVWPAEDVAVGICRQIRERGGDVWLDGQLGVVHG